LSALWETDPHNKAMPIPVTDPITTDPHSSVSPPPRAPSEEDCAQLGEFKLHQLKSAGAGRPANRAPPERSAVTLRVRGQTAMPAAGAVREYRRGTLKRHTRLVSKPSFCLVTPRLAMIASRTYVFVPVKISLTMLRSGRPPCSVTLALYALSPQATFDIFGAISAFRI